MAMPKLAVYKFASCDGCQLSILDVEDHLLDIASVVHIANFPEASREVVEGPYDLTLIEQYPRETPELPAAFRDTAVSKSDRDMLEALGYVN